MSSEAITKNDLIAILNELGMPYSMLDYHPIGSYLWTSEASYDPNIAMGGEWELMDEGITLVSAGHTYTVQSGTSKDGGEESVALDMSEMPSHNHNSKSLTGHFTQRRYGGSSSQFTWCGGMVSYQANVENSGYGITASNLQAKMDRFTINATHTHDTQGEGQAHENMPPYKAAYCWHRIG